MSNTNPTDTVIEASGRARRVHDKGRPVPSADWMSDIDWLRQREEKILARICEEDAPTGRMSPKPSDRRARRDALLMIRLRIAELEAEETWRGSRTRTSNPV